MRRILAVLALVLLLALPALWLAALALFLWIEPRCLRGPYAMMDAAVWPIWLAHVHEMKPLIALTAESPLTGIAIAQQSSLQHELLHGHPFRSALLNELLGTPALSLTVPYGRFRATHLAHHHDPLLTDPYDDPESNYMDPDVWIKTPGWLRSLYRLNNTLLGRIVLGPILGNLLWLGSEARLLAEGAPGVRRD